MGTEIIRKSILAGNRDDSILSDNGQDSKFCKMKKALSEMREYLQNGTEDINCSLSRYLQALSVTIDLSIFNPRSNMATDFFVTLHELISKSDAKSSFTWLCVDVLSNACRNSAARSALINNYQFVPVLSRILVNQVDTTKKVQLLKLLKDLTCGIKISWQFPYLPYLMKTLNKWVDGKEEETVALSLGVLVNLCYKNLPALYALTSNVDIKQLIKNCLRLKSPEIEMQVCKLMMICDKLNGSVQSEEIPKFFEVSFIAITNAFEERDYISLRQLVEFYMDIQKDYKVEYIYLKDLYEREIPKLLEIVVEAAGPSDEEEDAFSFSECMSSIFQFLRNLLEIRTETLTKLYPKIVQICLEWMQNNVVWPQSMSILKTIIVDASAQDTQILKPLGDSLPVFLMTLELDTDEDYLENDDYVRKIGAVLQLFRVMMSIDSLRTKILKKLKEGTILKLLKPLKDEFSSVEATNLISDLTVLYVHAIVLVDEMAHGDVRWVSIRDHLFSQPHVHRVLSRALYGGSKEMKLLVFELANLPTFPRGPVADIMTSLQDMFGVISGPATKYYHSISEISTPVLPITQVEKLDELLKKLKNAVDTKNFAGTSVSEVMELYEHKVAYTAHGERIAMASLEAATERATQLQHQIAQLTSCINKQHQLLLYTQQQAAEAHKHKEESKENILMLSKAFEAKKKETDHLKHELSIEKTKLIEISASYEETCNLNKRLEGRQEQLGRLVLQLEEKSAILEKNLNSKDEALKHAVSLNEELNLKISQLKQNLEETQKELNNKDRALETAEMEIVLKKQIINNILTVVQQNT